MIYHDHDAASVLRDGCVCVRRDLQHSHAQGVACTRGLISFLKSQSSWNTLPRRRAFPRPQEWKDMACRQGLIPAISVRLVLESKGPWHRNGGSLAIRDLYQVPCSGAPSCHFRSGHTHTPAIPSFVTCALNKNSLCLLCSKYLDPTTILLICSL